MPRAPVTMATDNCPSYFQKVKIAFRQSPVATEAGLSSLSFPFPRVALGNS